MDTLTFPAGKVILPHGATRAEWLEVRRGGIGASEVSTLVGLNPYQGRYELWLDKTGRAPKKRETRRMRMGNILEPVVRDITAEELGVTIEQVGIVQSTAHPFARATPDGICSDGNGFEAKTTNWRRRDDWADGQVADHAELQAQFSMGVTGLPGWHVAGMIDGDPDDFHHALVPRDEDLIGMLFEVAEEFYVDHVLADKAPPMDSTSLAVVKRMNEEVRVEFREVDPAEAADALAAYHAALELEKAAKAQKNLAQARLINLVGDATEARVDGKKAFTYKQQTREAYTVKASTFRTLYVPKPTTKKEAPVG